VEGLAYTLLSWPLQVVITSYIAETPRIVLNSIPIEANALWLNNQEKQMRTRTALCITWPPSWAEYYLCCSSLPSMAYPKLLILRSPSSRLLSLRKYNGREGPAAK
jgi:hypothetical protein